MVNIKVWFRIFRRLLIGGLFLLLFINLFILQFSAPYITSDKQLIEKEAYDAILVLGAKVYPDRPSLMLKERLDGAIMLYENNISDRILVSGDDGQKYYNEVIVMKSYLEDAGIPSDHIFMDHAGFNTYSSLYRARDVFQVKSLVVSTQQYHQHRAIYIGRRLGLDVWGYDGNTQVYPGMVKYHLRESLARAKALFQVEVSRPEPRYLGDPVPLYHLDHIN